MWKVIVEGHLIQFNTLPCGVGGFCCTEHPEVSTILSLLPRRQWLVYLPMQSGHKSPYIVQVSTDNCVYDRQLCIQTNSGDALPTSSFAILQPRRTCTGNMLSHSHHVVFSRKYNASTFWIPTVMLACHFMCTGSICALVTTHLNKIVILPSYLPQMPYFPKTSQGHLHIPFSCNTMSPFSKFNANSWASWSASNYGCTRRLRNWKDNIMYHVRY